MNNELKEVSVFALSLVVILSAAQAGLGLVCNLTTTLGDTATLAEGG